MKDRIFPTLQQEGEIASEKEFAGINWDKFAQNFDGKVEKTASSLPEGLEEILNNDIVDDSIREAKSDDDKKDEDEKPWFEKFKSKDKKETDKDETEETDKDETEEDEEDGEDKIMTKHARTRKVHFSSVDEISADAIESAKASGSEELVNTILAARKQRRVHLATKIAQTEEAMVKTASKDVEDKLQGRNAYRQALAAKIETIIDAQPEKKSKIKVSVNNTDTFKKVSSLNTAEKRAFAQAAMAQGFPMDYVDSILGDTAAEQTEDVVGGIKEVMSSKIPTNMKKAALEGMIKTAKLDDAQKNRIIDYWINDLQYGDEEWVRNWVNKNYD